MKEVLSKEMCLKTDPHVQTTKHLKFTVFIVYMTVKIENK